VALTQPIPDYPTQRDEGSPEDVALVVLGVIAADPKRGWRTSELVRAIPQARVLDVMNAIMTMHVDGRLERVSAATYRLPTRGRRATAAKNHHALWGED